MIHFVWRRVRRPEEIVEATRWVFALFVLVTLFFGLPALLVMDDSTTLFIGLSSWLVLGLSWSVGYLRQIAPLWMDLVDAVALLGFALACPSPLVAVGLIMPALWFRSLYSSTRRALVRAGLYAGAMFASLPLWAHAPGHTGGVEVGPMLGAIPAMLLTVFASTQLAGGLHARGQAAQRDAVHMTLGAELLGVTDTEKIRRIAWTAIAGIIAATPGLRVLKVVLEGSALRVEGAIGGFAGVPVLLPATLLSATDGGRGRVSRKRVQSHADLDAAVGTPCVWACISMPPGHSQQGSAWLLLGSPRKVPPQAMIAVGTVVNQVTLALQNGEVHEKLTILAEVDSLTGLANRASFNAALVAALGDRSLPDASVLFVDLDDFKDVNDVFGHQAGDDLLREVAARLRQTTRPGDLCARLGGDEFAVLLHDTPTVAKEVAQRIVSAVRVAVHVGGGIARVGASVGIATATNETDLEQLLHRADLAMYAAKAQGKGKIQVFEPGLLRVDSSRVVFDQQLASAVDKGELVVHYQPVLSLPDGRCVAMEALVRWQHPERGLLYPDSFIETAERIGAIRDIGAFVLHRACADTAIWRETFPDSPLSIHISISARQLDDVSFIETVTECLREFSLSPDRLVLEVTETIVFSSPAAIERLNFLAARGVTIAIDNFGTGFSALTTLRSLPAQTVKIDKSLVARCPEDPQDRVVVEAIVKIAAQMGMQTIADGVERMEQQRFLDDIGADAAQGLLYLRPSTAEEFGVWLGTHLAGLSQTRDARDVVIQFMPRMRTKG